eukprot:g1787.t1
MARYPANRAPICLGDAHVESNRCGRILAVVIARIILPLPDCCCPWRKNTKQKKNKTGCGSSSGLVGSTGTRASLEIDEEAQRVRAVEEETYTVLCNLLCRLIHSRAFSHKGGTAKVTHIDHGDGLSDGEQDGGDGGGKGGGGRFVCTLKTLGSSCVSRLLELLLFGSGGMERVRALRMEARQQRKRAKKARVLAEQHEEKQKTPSKVQVQHVEPTPLRRAKPASNPFAGQFGTNDSISDAAPVSVSASTMRRRRNSIEAIEVLDKDDDAAFGRAAHDGAAAQTAASGEDDSDNAASGSDAEEIDKSGKKAGTAETDKVARAEAQAEEEMEQREALRWSAEARKCDWRLRTAAAECLAKLADDPGAAVAIVEPQPEAIPLLVQLLRVSDFA